jgi:hypothetical protein
MHRRQVRDQGHLSRDVRRENRRNDGPKGEQIDFVAVDAGALNQFRNAEAAKLDRGERLEHGAGSREWRSQPGDYGDATAIGPE